MRKVEVVAYKRDWVEAFNRESKQLKDIFRDLVLAIHHIGSTAIPGIKAKPIIDILVEVKDIREVDQLNNELSKLGYVALGE